MECVRVFGFAGSPFVDKVCNALSIKGLRWELHETATPQEMSRASPVTGKMPTVQIGEDPDAERLYDSTLILRKLEQLKPDPPLWSADPQIAVRQRLLEDWCDESLYWYIMAMRWQDDNAPRAIAQITPGMSRPLALLLGIVLRRKLTRAIREQGLGRLPDEVLNGEVKNVLSDLSIMLGNSPFFLSDTLSAADLAVHGQFGFGLSGSTPAFEQAFARHANLQAFQSRVSELVESRRLG